MWRDIDRDPETSVVLLRGEGGVFSAGGDLGMIEAMTRDWATRTRVWKEASDLVYNVINCSKPIVAAIEGPCVGAGLAAAMVADITVAGRKALAGKRPMTKVGRAVEKGETQGFMKVVVDAETKQILGAAILGTGGDEAIHTILDVMYAKAPYTVLQRATHIHPTVSELIPTMLGELHPL